MDKITRVDIEEYFYKFVKDMGDSGENLKRYKAFFASMDDKEFYTYMYKFIKDPKRNYKLYYPQMNNDAGTIIEFFTKAADKRKISIFNHIVYPHLNGDENQANQYGSSRPVLSLHILNKRLAQTTMSKTNITTDISKRNFETGLASGDSRGGRFSEPELNSSLANGQRHAALEYMTLRADSVSTKREAYKAIVDTGELAMSDLPESSVLDKVALNTFNYYVYGSFFTTNIIDRKGLMLPMGLSGDQRNISSDIEGKKGKK
jgi:hypothetical protein